MTYDVHDAHPGSPTDWGTGSGCSSCGSHTAHETKPSRDTLLLGAAAVAGAGAYVLLKD